MVIAMPSKYGYGTDKSNNCGDQVDGLLGWAWKVTNMFIGSELRWEEEEEAVNWNNEPKNNVHYRL